MLHFCCAATTAAATAIEDLVWQLEGIWKYAALDYHIRTKGIVANKSRRANEYAITLMKLWDALDRFPQDTVEDTLVELEGKIVVFEKPETSGEKKQQADMKALRTQLEQYLQVRREGTLGEQQLQKGDEDATRGRWRPCIERATAEKPAYL